MFRRPQITEDAFWVFLTFQVTFAISAVQTVVHEHLQKQIKNLSNRWRHFPHRELRVSEESLRRFNAVDDPLCLCHSVTDAPPVHPHSKPDEL